MSRIAFVILLCFILVMVADGSISVDCEVIETKSGKISGTKLLALFGDRNDTSFYAYRGIRYGKAPVGKLRFKAPVASGSWSGTLNAVAYGPSCIQQAGTANTASSEDCLFLNVFTPNSQVCNGTTENIPVLVWVYGGSFTEGVADDSLYSPYILMNQRIVLVTLNYRVGMFGFLSLHEKEYSGNMGLKDQKLAIKWVKNHIASFGGDTNRITIFGESAGGTSVLYQGLNEESRQNFQQIFAMSGSPIKFNSRMQSNNHTDVVLDLADKVGVTVQGNKDLIRFLRNVSSNDIVQYTSGSSDYGLTFDPKWGPVIERKKGKNAFLWRDPLDLYKTKANKVPTYISHLTMEYITLVLAYIADPSTTSFLNDNFTISLPYRDLDQVACANEIRSILNAMRTFYFADEVIGNATIRQFVRMLSDMNYAYPIQRTVALLAAKSKAPIHYQITNPRTPLNLLASRPGVAALGGTGHSEDIFYFFYSETYASLYAEYEESRYSYQPYIEANQVSKVLVELLVNFATNGIPSTETGSLNEYPTVRENAEEEQTYVEISNTGRPLKGSNYNWPAFKLWTWIDEQVDAIKQMSCNQYYLS